MTRREVLVAGLAAPLAARKAPGLRIGTMDGVLKLSGKPEAVEMARKLGFAGLQVTLGRPGEGGRMPLEDSGLQARYVAESKKHSLPIDATYIDVLHASCLKSDRESRDWVLKGIDVTRKLRAPILMTVFFGKCSVLNRTELDSVVGAFKELAPAAEKAGVILGFENLLKAEDNLRACDQVASKAFRIYYDVGNATNMVGADAAQEIRALGKNRICQFHFKDKGYLGEGAVGYPAILEAIDAIGFRGYANLETGSPSGSIEDDAKRNLAYIQGLMRA